MNEIVLNALRVRITSVFPAQIRAAVSRLNDEQIWWRPNEASNSIGNLVLHLTGSLNHYLNRNLGGFAFERDRAAEFGERSPMSKRLLLARFDDMVSKAEQTFQAMTPLRLADHSPEPSMHTLVIEDLLNITAHLANHAGQIVWIAKMFEGPALEHVWTGSHRAGGAWPKKD